jgi:hypothetical protein
VVANHLQVAATPSTCDSPITMQACLMVRVEWTVSSSLHNGVSQCVLGPPVCRSVGPAVHSTHMRDCLLAVLPQERDGPTTTRSFAGGGALQHAAA